MAGNRVTLVEAIWEADNRSRRMVRNAVIVATGALLLAISAQITIPWTPVPFTMQTYVVLVLGIASGPALGVATGGLYLLLGLAGLPVFADGGSRAALAGPTAGYLVGFVVAMAVVGFVARRGWDKRWIGVLAALLIGELVIFGFGLTWLARALGSWELAVTHGLVPFVWSETLKVGLAAATVPAAWSLLNRE